MSSPSSWWNKARADGGGCDCALLLWGWCWDWDLPPDDEDSVTQKPAPTSPHPSTSTTPPTPTYPYNPPTYPSTPQMARDLDNTMAQNTHALAGMGISNSTPQSAYTGAGYNNGNNTPGFTQPRGPSPLPPKPAGAGEWSPWGGAGSLGAGTPPGRTPSPLPPARLPSPPRDSLTVPLPALPALNAALPTVTSPAHDPALQLAWARDVLFLVDRTPALASSPLALAAVPLILKLASATPPTPEALYLRATFASSGAYPTLVPANPRAAFRDFEQAARAGWAGAWFRLGRDYEAFNDTAHALDCLNRGAKAGDPASLHRLGVAHLLGQLGLPTGGAANNVDTALGYLSKAAVRATLQCPAPAYVFALILLNEFSVEVKGESVARWVPQGQTPPQYARALLERAAALHFPPAQYKLGHAFEFAVPASAFPFDPLLSVQWYSLASQAGEAEADMALSKWFLCGAEGAFDKDEALARTFAAKAAAKGLAAGEFAMGYYCEVGIGGARDLDGRGGSAPEEGGARGWYEKAAAHGNTDAAERLRALAQPAAQALGRTEHDALTGDKLVRKRTQARMRSDREGAGAPQYTAEPGSYANPHPEMPDPYGTNANANAGAGAGRGGGGGRAPPSAFPVQAGAYGQNLGPTAPLDPASRRTRVMELARKSSLADAGHYRAGSPGGGLDYRAGGANAGFGSPGPQAPGGYTSPPPQGFGTPPPGAGPSGRGRGGPQQQPGRLPPRQGSPAAGPGRQASPAGAGRGYALSDGGSRPGSVAGSVASTGGAGGRAQGVPPGRRPANASASAGGAAAPAAAGGGGGSHEGIVTPMGGGGPATFAEMGFTGAKAEDKECVIM
ncbi:HCP-like protein [Mycena crocata]|nr:HCP-like protein [Mycena crocata]